MYNFLLVLIVVLVLIRIVYCISMEIYTHFDHKKWMKDAHPNKDADIADVKTEEVQYLKNGAKYKTVITFTDGFRFTTYATKRKEGFFRYRISIDKELGDEILWNAKNYHRTAVDTYMRKMKKEREKADKVF